MPHIPLVAVGGQAALPRRSRLTGTVDCLDGLPRYTGGIFVAAAAPPAQTLQVAGETGSAIERRSKVIPFSPW